MSTVRDGGRIFRGNSQIVDLVLSDVYRTGWRLDHLQTFAGKPELVLSDVYRTGWRRTLRNTRLHHKLVLSDVYRTGWRAANDAMARQATRWYSLMSTVRDGGFLT